MNRKIKKIIIDIFIFHIPLFLMLSFVLAPFIWALLTSFKSERDVIGSKITYIPSSITFENYISVWEKSRFSTYFFNSLFVAIIAVIIVLLLSIINAYAISRFKFKLKKSFMMFLLATQLMPVILFIVPSFIVFKKLGLVNSLTSLIIFYTVLQAPFSTLLMKGFIEGIPKQIDEAAIVDGASRFQIIFRLILPLLLPGIVATGAFAFIGCWNEFLVAFSFITSLGRFTIPIGLKYMIGEYSVNYPALAAGSIIGLIPPVILFAYIQKYLIQGLGSGSVKG